MLQQRAQLARVIVEAGREHLRTHRSQHHVGGTAHQRLSDGFTVGRAREQPMYAQEFVQPTGRAVLDHRFDLSPIGDERLCPGRAALCDGCAPQHSFHPAGIVGRPRLNEIAVQCLGRAHPLQIGPGIDTAGRQRSVHVRRCAIGQRKRLVKRVVLPRRHRQQGFVDGRAVPESTVPCQDSFHGVGLSVWHRFLPRAAVKSLLVVGLFPFREAEAPAVPHLCGSPQRQRRSRTRSTGTYA